jgi:steroid 5-alpha reductase family enzyme
MTVTTTATWGTAAMKPAHAFLMTLAVVVLAKTVAWWLQLRTRNAGLVDPIWAFTLGLLAVLYAAVGWAPLLDRIVLAVMGAAWGLRLGVHLWTRNYGKPEDWRYAQFRARWGAAADRNMFWFFQFQNLFTLMLSASAFLPVAYRYGPAPVWSFVAAGLIWCGSVYGEGLADRQMERFRNDPANRGKVCRDGLWRYSRHPNYFFECLHWLAYAPLAWASPYGGATLAAPLVMGILLMKLSGIPLLEAGMMQRKPGYADYVRSTSALIPWPPKKL